MVSTEEIICFIENNIQDFHYKRIQSIQSLKLKKILQRKNPYLFRAKNIDTAESFIRNILDAHLSSQEEGVFGAFLEKLAIFICSKTYGGTKSSAEGIDLEFEKSGIKYVVAIKSGPNWGNSGQIQKMIDNFKKAKRILGTNSSLKNVVAINGCCYGIEIQTDKGDYKKLCGKDFWEFISGNENLYIEIIEPLGHKAKEKNEEFLESYSQIINIFTQEFLNVFCTDGKIDWKTIIQFNSYKQ
jgi:hypothetical protein